MLLEASKANYSHVCSVIFQNAKLLSSPVIWIFHGEKRDAYRWKETFISKLLTYSDLVVHGFGFSRILKSGIQSITIFAKKLPLSIMATPVISLLFRQIFISFFFRHLLQFAKRQRFILQQKLRKKTLWNMHENDR